MFKGPVESVSTNLLSIVECSDSNLDNVIMLIIIIKRMCCEDVSEEIKGMGFVHTYMLNGTIRTSWGWWDMRWHCPPDTGFKIRALSVWNRARYLSVMEAPHNIESLRVSRKETCLFLWNLKARVWFEHEISDFPSRQFKHFNRAPAPRFSRTAVQ